MTQQYVALRAQVSDIPTLVAADTYELTASIFDDTSLYDGTDVAATYLLLVPRGTANDMDIYTISSVSATFALQATFQVTDGSSQGNPGFGVFALVQASPSGLLPEVSGVSDALNQAITQYNLAIFETLGGGTDTSIGSDDQTLTADRTVDLNGNALSFENGVQSVEINDGSITTTANLEVTGSGNGIIRTAPNGDRFLETTNALGVTTSTKLP